MKIILYFIFLISFSFISEASDQTDAVLFKGSDFKAEVIAKNLGIPWGMTFLNKNEMLFTEREGFMKKLHLPSGKISSIKGVPSASTRNQGGLLDITKHPYFQKNKLIYFTYSIKKGSKTTTALARAVLHKNKLKKLKILFQAKPFYSSGMHYGSRIAFDKNNNLYMTVGDRGQKKEAQNLKSHLGSVLKMTDQGKPASDNPFLNSKSAQPEIWSYGHRNPQGLFIHPDTKDVYVQEHGPKGGDEINKIKKGANYGWPIITYGRTYIGNFKIGEGTHKKGMEQPIKYFVPSIAPSGLLIYSGKQFPKWKGDFFSGSLVLRHLNKIKFLKNQSAYKEERLLVPLKSRVRNVIEGPRGYIYVALDSGTIVKISPHRP